MMTEMTLRDAEAGARDIAAVDSDDEPVERATEAAPAPPRPELRMFDGGEAAHCEGDACLLPVKRG